MAFLLIDPRRKKSGSTLENVAEDVLNGLFCHYEPPTSEYAQHKAANLVRENPTKYTFSKVKKRSKSILRTSKQFKKKAMIEEQKKRGVTWRDEENRRGLEGKVATCATDKCDILGVLTKAGRDLEDTLSPTKAGEESFLNPFTTPTIQAEAAASQGKEDNESNEDTPAKKVLYDDEGNPIDENGEAIDQENVPPAPTGMSQLRKLAKSLDQNDMYEPENYDRPKGDTRSGVSLTRNPTPLRRREDEYYVEDAIMQTRSDSPTNGGAIYKRPGTPFRTREEGEDADSFVGRSIRGRQDYNQYSGAPSPGGRSAVFSEITMDEALSGRGRYPQSPARTSEGIEIDMNRGQPRAHSRSPGQRASSSRSKADRIDLSSDWDLGQDLTQIRSKSYEQRRSQTEEDRGDISGDDRAPAELSTPNKSSDDKSRRHSSGDYLQKYKDNIEKKKSSSKSRRTSAPLPLDTSDEKQSRRKSSRGTKSKSIEESSTKEKESSASRQRDPTPRMSVDPSTEEGRPDQTQPLPPTPRRKDEKEHHRSRSQKENNTDRKSTEKKATSKSKDSSRRKSREGGRAKEGTYDQIRKKYSTPKSPSSVATDDEIRAEVSSVGMESSTLRPFNYRNPFMNVPPPVMHDKSTNESENASKAVSKSTVSTGTKKSQDSPEIVQTSSSGSGTVRTKKLWKGWRNAVGKVKSIVNDIDEQRLPAPIFPLPQQEKADLTPQHPNLYSKRNGDHR